MNNIAVKLLICTYMNDERVETNIADENGGIPFFTSMSKML